MKQNNFVPTQTSTTIPDHCYKKKKISQQVIEFTVAVLKIKIDYKKNMQGKQIQCTFPTYSGFTVLV